ncbi:MAG: hypothetical protein P4L41_10980, partial [Flavipsychrobacter sp.]|nr:hypothetical protein [Flavipsychrobacter sp.]
IHGEFDFSISNFRVSRFSVFSAPACPHLQMMCMRSSILLCSPDPKQTLRNGAQELRETDCT